MEGTLRVESEFGKGSAFTVRVKQGFVSDTSLGKEITDGLKGFRFADKRRNKNSKLVYIPLSYARVLVVDDVQANLDVAKGMMKPYGMTIDCVSSGMEAIEAIRLEKHRYNAIFMDHMMPEIDGIEATRMIREIDNDYARAIPIIALTANAIIGNEEMFLSRGFQAFLSKPIDMMRLDSVIRQWVRDRDL
jgi:CheY-like chemotaxis protein